MTYPGGMIESQSESTVGNRIRAVRIERGWTQAELAEQIGVSRSAVAQWETDRAGQLRDHLGRIAQVLNVSTEFLLIGREGQASTAEELALLRLYREAPPEDRQLLLRTARRLVNGAM